MSFPAAGGPSSPDLVPHGPGIYVHIPFCSGKCHYCAFDSQPVGGHDLDRYLAALLGQAEAMAGHPAWQDQKFATLYIGGGTPTVLGGTRLATLVTRLRQTFQLAAEAEITVEANPESADPSLLAALRAAGANRLSLGVQSFDDVLLRTIGRRHTGAQAAATVIAANQAGFRRISLDLMTGLPGQTPAQWRASLETALALDTDHLSLYELTIESPSRFASAVPADLPDEDAILAMDDITAELLTAAGFQRYEIANHCRPGRYCRHNLNYWHNGDYLGLGAGAVSCRDGLRLKTVTAPEAFVRRVEAGLPVYSEGEALSLAARFRETVVLGLRLIHGIDLAVLERRFALTTQAVYGDLPDRLAAQGLLQRNGSRIALSAAGLAVANRVMAELV